jgi:hypothetical protein
MVRSKSRKSILDALGQPWSSFCTDGGRKQLVDALNYYYGQREAQLRSYGNIHGEPGRRHVIKAWSTTDDSRVERLVRENYGRGYIKLNVLGTAARKAVSELTRDDRVTAKPCA